MIKDYEIILLNCKESYILYQNYIKIISKLLDQNY